MLKDIKYRWAVILFVIIAASYLIWPTYKLYSLTETKKKEVGVNIIKELKQDRFHLTIIGDGPERNNLKELAKTLNISHIVDFIGFKD